MFFLKYVFQNVFVEIAGKSYIETSVETVVSETFIKVKEAKCRSDSYQMSCVVALFAK
jgi:hypothetical protein